MKKKTILCIVGTRPEVIKMAPVILALQHHACFDVKVVATAQHRQMLDSLLRLFEITPDMDLNIMQPNQGLPELSARLLLALDDTFQKLKPDIVIAQGDTTTVLCAALASFYRRIAFCHVEAGLRTGDVYHPFPEEMNRVLASKIACLHFAPTHTAVNALLREGIAENTVFMTGNTVIDALMMIVKQSASHELVLDSHKKIILVTAHRRENFGAPFVAICNAIRAIAEKHEDVQIVYPVHPNPKVKEVAKAMLDNHPRILLCEPLDYAPFVSLMKQSYLILTDSGGVQEEAPALGKPVLVLREETERPEALSAGVVKLVGTDEKLIIEETEKLLKDTVYYKNMAKGVSPYGDGRAAERIVKILTDRFL